MGILPEIQHHSKAHYIYNSSPKAVENSLDLNLAIKNIFLSCGISFIQSVSHAPGSIAWSLIILYFKYFCCGLPVWNCHFAHFLSFRPLGHLRSCEHGWTITFSRTLWPCNSECPETAPAHPFIIQYNLKILCIRLFCLSEQYSALSALRVDHVKDAVKQS